MKLDDILKAFDKIKNQGMSEQTYAVSPKAYDMGLKILEMRPDIILQGEAHIWLVAKQLGLLEQDKK